MSIGTVLAQLRDDFPDITISKIRFLESEGLVTPERAPSGYRRFSQADCDRLRFVLTAQRDRYLPLKVIKEQLDAIDNGNGGFGPGGTRVLSAARGTVAPATDFGARAGRVSRETLIERTGVDSAFVTELQRNGLLILANHPTLIDVVLLVSLLPNADCVVKHAVARNPFMRGPVRAAGYVANSDGAGLVDDCIAAVHAGGNLVIFPEGTRTEPGQPLRLQRGAANIAVRGRLDITPVRITCTPLTLTKGQKWYRVPSRRFHV